MNKVSVQIFVPIIEEKYDIFIPSNKNIKNVINLVSNAINEITDGNYVMTNNTLLYDKKTGIPYDITKTIKEAQINNGAQLILY